MRLDFPIFRCTLLYRTDCDVQTAVDYFYDYKRSRSILEPRPSDGWVQTAGGDIFMWVKDAADVATLHHEITHVAFTLCEIKGMAADEELICYLVGWLTRNLKI